MPTKPRIVQCPKCRALLQEPPPGNPFYQCGRCSTTLQAKCDTTADVKGSNLRISADQQSRYSYSDSSGEIVSDVVADEFSLMMGNGNESPLQNKKIEASAHIMESAPENGSHGRDARGVTNLQRVHPQDRVVVDPYVQSLRNQEMHMKERVLDVVSGTEQDDPGRTAAQQEIGSGDSQRPSSPDASSYGIMSGVQVQRAELRRSHTDVLTTSSAEPKLKPTMSSVGNSYRTTKRLTSESRTYENLNVPGEVQQLQQVSHVQSAHPDFPLESVQDAGYNDNHHLSLGGRPNDEPDASNGLLPPSMAAVGTIVSSASRAKLRWQVRESDSGDEATSSGAASSKGISEDDDGSSQDDGKSSSMSVKETTSVEYVVERKWRTVHSHRRSFAPDRRPLDEQGDLSRTRSDDSDRTVDMYENSVHVLDYEQSDTSSTTMEEVDIINGGGAAAPPGRFSGEMDRFTATMDQGISRIASRPNLPRSSPTSSARSALSEESGSYSPQTESPDSHLGNNNVRAVVTTRRHSWDERVSRIGAAAPGSIAHHQGSASVRLKSASHDYGSAQAADQLQRMSSDLDGRTYNRGRQLPPSLYDSYRQASQFAIRPLQPQQQWVNRYLPASQSPLQQQPWSPNSPHRSFFPEPSPLHPLQSRLRQIPSQLPPKQGLYPPLPPPGALPHVLCQHCELLLLVPDNLPQNQKSTQKLRCGSCRKISIFSVPQAEGSTTAAQAIGTTSRSESLNSQTLLASSPDSQAEFTSAYRAVSDSLGAGDRQRSVRRYTMSDLAQKQQVQAPLVRKHSLGNEDLTAVDEEMVDRGLSDSFESLSNNSNSAAAAQFFAARASEMVNGSTYPDLASPNVPATEFRGPSDNTSSQPEELLSEPLEVLANRDKPGGRYNRFTNVSQTLNGGGDNVPSEEKRSSEILLRESESNSIQRSRSATSSPKLNQSYSGSSILHANSAPVQDSRSSDASHEQGYEARGLNSKLKSIFWKSKQAGSSHYRRRVVVNGVAIPDHLVKKAEEQAGPLYPGTYWYDVQAGFWGVAGGQCLGIIPPFIEELNSPMTRDCAAGRTGIFVNGRELHHTDRDVLCRRGLPDTPGMSYRIEIDGRVVEEASGSELRSLGRLAPSLEKSGRGAGMKVPSNISGGRS